MSDVVLFGAGQIAEVAKAYMDAHGSDRVVGFTVDGAFRQAETFAGLPLVAWEQLESRFPPSAVKLLGPLSYRALNELRRDRHAEGKARGYSFASFIHPASHVYADAIGENAFILEANVIQPFVTIGQGVMLWSGNHIGHHSVIEDYCFLASHVVLGSNVRVGERTFAGGCVLIEPGVTVGAGCLLNLGATVKKDVPPDSVVDGAPNGRVVRLGNARLKRLF
jgi:sugar O-acyltransferase (sialic acid O-acetyltransferase NeuD family)